MVAVLFVDCEYGLRPGKPTHRNSGAFFFASFRRTDCHRVPALETAYGDLPIGEQRSPNPKATIGGK